MNQTPKQNKGCAWIFTFGLFAFVLSVLIMVVIGLEYLPSIVLAAVISFFITQKILGKSDWASLLKNIVSLFLIIVILRFALITLFSILQSSIQEEQRFQIEEGVGISNILEEGDTISVYSSHRVWKDNYGNDYNGNLTVRERDFLRLYQSVDRFTLETPGNFWGKLYDYLERNDSPSLDLVIKTFEQLQEEKHLNQMEFAEMIVSCVQDIPYSFVFQSECLAPENYEEAIRSVLEVCPECCIGNKTYGIQNPVSFIQNLKGDCDTRTVLVFTLLKHFNYDVAILNSDFYLHSVIGINLPASGSHKTHRGRNYYTWETTAKYYTIGELPVNFNDLTHWNVVLTSK